MRERTVFRPLDGILLLDKPAGISSNQALQRVRHLYRAEKAGHTGSLDPLATGMLPVCFGEATKVAGLLLGHGKAYLATARLGVVTDTDDADGTPLRERPVPALGAAAVEAALAPLRGLVKQRPPIYSALKQGGEPLYAKARRGESIEVPEREVRVDAIELLAIDGAELSLQITCGSGTYVRSLVRDLGEALGCGAHVRTLHRLWVSPFEQSPMHGLEALRSLRETAGEAAIDALLLPVEAGLAGRRRCVLDPVQALALGRGQPVQLSVKEPAGEVNVVDPEGRSLGLGEIDGAGWLRARRLFRWAAQG